MRKYLLLCLLAFLPAVSFANQGGFFIHGDVGRSSYYNNSGYYCDAFDYYCFTYAPPSNTPSNVSLDKNDVGFSALAGYRWDMSHTDWQGLWRTAIGVEAGYVNLGTLKATYYPSGSGYAKSSGWMLGGNARMALSDKWYVTGHLGLLFSNTRSSVPQLASGGNIANVTGRSHYTSAYFGVGLDYDITSQFSIGMDLDDYDVNASPSFADWPQDAWMLSAAAEYRF